MTTNSGTAREIKPVSVLVLSVVIGMSTGLVQNQQNQVIAACPTVSSAPVNVQTPNLNQIIVPSVTVPTPNIQTPNLQTPNIQTPNLQTSSLQTSTTTSTAIPSITVPSPAAITPITVSSITIQSPTPVQSVTVNLDCK